MKTSHLGLYILAYVYYPSTPHIRNPFNGGPSYFSSAEGKVRVSAHKIWPVLPVIRKIPMIFRVIPVKMTPKHQYPVQDMSFLCNFA